LIHKKTIIHLLILIISSYICLHITAELTAEEIHFDNRAIHLHKGDILHIGDSLYIAEKDTTLLLPGTTPFFIETRRNMSQEKLDSLEYEAERSKITEELYKLAVRKHQSSSNDPLYLLEKSQYQFLPYRGLIIRNIEFVHQPVFRRVSRNTPRIVKTIRNAATKLHVTTKSSVVRDILLFKEGELLDPFILAENQRIIYELPFIETVDFGIRLCEDDPQGVDVIITTKDKFSIGANPGLSSLSKGRLEVYDLNFAGLGHEVSTTVAYDEARKKPLYIQNSEYKIYHIGSTFLCGRMFYTDQDVEKQYGFEIQRNAIPPKINIAGGVGLKRVHELYANILNDTTSYWLDYLESELCIGIANDVYKKENGKTAFTVPTLRLASKKYLIESGVYGRKTHEQVFFGLNFLKSKFYKSNLIYDFGKVEYIPYGHLGELVAGMEFEDDDDRNFYLGFRFSEGDFVFKDLLYYYYKISLGSYVDNLLYFTLNRGVFSLKMQFFTKLYQVWNYGVRNFIKVDYIQGIDQPSYNFLYIDNLEDIDGFKDALETGQQRLVFNIENVAFSDWEFLGFRFAIFTLCDVGFIGKCGNNIFQETSYMGIGAGVRVKNESLVFKTIQLEFMYYPNIDGTSKFTFSLSGQPELVLPDFEVKCPRPINYE